MRNLLNGRDLRIREDVALDPGIGRALRNIATDGMEQEQAVVGEQPTHVLEVRAVIAPTDVLEHPERVDAIESSLQRSVILQQDGHRQALAARAGGLRLIFETVTPVTLTPYRSAANCAAPPHPQPISSTRIPGSRRSLRQTKSSLASCALSRSFALRQYPQL